MLRFPVIVFLIIGCRLVFALDPVERYTEPAEIVSPGTFPWIVYITDRTGDLTGVLFSNKHILTSAHGLDVFPDGDCLKANFKNAHVPFSVKAERFIIHPKYNNSKVQSEAFDFAIVELERPVSLEDHGAKLPVLDTKCYSFSDTYDIPPVYSAGYGISDTLKK